MNTVNRYAGGNSYAGFTAGSIYARESYSGQSNAYSSGAASGTAITSTTPTGESPLFVKYYWNMTAPSASVAARTVDYGTAISLTAKTNTISERREMAKRKSPLPILCAGISLLRQ